MLLRLLKLTKDGRFSIAPSLRTDAYCFLSS
jgi:hypothetical protein